MQPLNKLLLACCLLVICNQIAFAYQNQVTSSGFIKDRSFLIGYHYNFGEPNTSKFHLLEIGYQKSSTSGVHATSANWYATSEMGFVKNSFLIGPKLGGFVSFGGFVLGSEFIYYTNFRDESLRFVPYFGIGGKPFRLSINPHIRLSNKDFERINRGSVSLRVAFPID